MEQAADQPPTALATAGSVATGRRRARDAVDAALAAIAGRNGAVNAFCEVRPSAARAAADTLDARLATGEVLGPLAGVPVAVKDVMWEAGVESTNGSRSLLGFVHEKARQGPYCAEPEVYHPATTPGSLIATAPLCAPGVVMSVTTPAEVRTNA